MIHINKALLKRFTLATCFFLLAIPYAAKALDEREEKTFRGTDLTAGAFPKTLTTKDAVFGTSAWSSQVSYGVKNMVKFEIDFFNTSERYFYGQSFTAKCNVTINCYSDPLNPNTVSKSYPNIDLDINFNPAPGSTYKGIATYKFDGSYKVDVVVNSVTATNINLADFPIFQLTNELIVTRQYNFTALFGSNAGTTSYSTDGSKLQLSWDPADYPGAESFDLEWTYIDELSAEGDYIKQQRNLGNVTIPLAKLAGYFRNNSSRINLSGGTHIFNLNYNKGFLLFRIRSVQYSVTDGLRRESEWNYKADGLTPNYNWFDQGIVDVDWHSENLNWQYNAVFAEDGARKEVISYFDGSFRSRQSVTLNNADNTAVVAEPVYDAMGRAAMTVLPAPIASDKLQYYPMFNVSNTTGKPLSYLDIPYANCGIIASPLKPGYGVEKYYSSANPFMNNPAKPWNDAIPQSEGFPFSVTQYTADNTGRIRAQGGVGKDLQLGTGHETKYYYGKPSQYELDRLFGAEAGDHTHYLKNMVVDGNHQVSVSYVNSDGQTIATALAGAPPTDKVDALPSAVPTASVHDVIITPNAFHIGNKKLEASATFLVPATAPYHFTWRFTPEKYAETYSGGQLCYQCSYDLVVKITDECGVEKASKLQKKITPFNISCTNPAEISGVMDVSLDLGEYSVSFELTINEETLDEYTADYLVRNVDLKKLKHFLLEQLAEENLAECYNDCESCRALPQDLDDFLDILRAYYAKEGVPFDQPEVDFGTELFDQIKSNCSNILANCTTSPCQDVFDVMLADVMPGGQYAEFDQNYELVDPEINVLANYTQLSFYDENNNPAMVEDENGNMVPPNQLSLKEFIQKFEESWASSLVPFHPEYCYYTWCTMNEESQLFNQKLEELYDATYAMDPAVGYFDRKNPLTLLEKDPFFNGGNGSPYYGDMKDDLLKYSDFVMHIPASTKDILKTIDYLLYCGNANPAIDWDNCNKPVDDECRSDYKEWLLFKQWYLERKLKYYQLAMQQVMPECKNCFIPSSGGADPADWTACVAPGKENFSVSVVENSTADGLKRIIIKYRGGNENTSWPLNVTIEMYNSSAQITQDLPVIFAPGFGTQEATVPEGFDVFTIKGVVCAELLAEDGTGTGAGRLASPKTGKLQEVSLVNAGLEQKITDQEKNSDPSQTAPILMPNTCDMPCPVKEDFDVTVRVFESHYMQVCYNGAEICPGRSVTAFVKVLYMCESDGEEREKTIQVDFCAGQPRCKEIFMGEDCYALTLLDVTPGCDVANCAEFTCPTTNDFLITGTGTNEITVCYTGAPIPAGSSVSIRRIVFKTTCDGELGYTVISPVFCAGSPTCKTYNLGNCIITNTPYMSDVDITCGKGDCSASCGEDYNSFVVRADHNAAGWAITTCYTGPPIPPGLTVNVSVDLKSNCGPVSFPVSFSSTTPGCFTKYFSNGSCTGEYGGDVYGTSGYGCSDGPPDWQCPTYTGNYSTSYFHDAVSHQWKVKVCYTGPAIPAGKIVLVDVYVETGCDKPYYFQAVFCSAQPLCRTITLSEEEVCDLISKVYIGNVVCEEGECEWQCPTDPSNYTLTQKPVPNTNKIEIKLCYWGPPVPNGRVVTVNVTGKRENCEDLFTSFTLCPGSGNCMTKVIDNGDCGKISELTIREVECRNGECPWECPSDGKDYDVTTSQLTDGSWQVTTCYLGAPIPAGKRVMANVMIDTKCGIKQFTVPFCSEWSSCQTRLFSNDDVCGYVSKGWVENAECNDSGCEWQCPEDKSNYIIRKKKNPLTHRDEISVCYTGVPIPFGKTVVVRVGVSGCDPNQDYEVRFCQGKTCNTKILKPGCVENYTAEIKEVYCVDEPCSAQCPEAASFTAVVNGTGCSVPNSQQSVNINVNHPAGPLSLTQPTERVKVAVEITTRKLATFKKTVTVKYVTFHNGDMSKDICFGYPAGYVVISVKVLGAECKGACPSGDCCDDPRYDLYTGKVRRFQDYVEPVIPASFEDYVNGGGVNFGGYAMSSCKSECESMADGWILDLKNCTTDPVKLERIRRKLIDVCKQSCEMQRGNLTIQPYSDNNPLPSFESVIRDEFGGSIPSCSEDLISDPYPWAKSPLPEKTFATETNNNICKRLEELKNEAAANGYGTSPDNLHEYLTKFYQPYYDLEVEELEDLYKGCDKCDGIIKLPVELPLFMDGNAKACKSCEEFDELKREFDQKYPGISTQDDKYEVLFKNFMNHKTGFSYSYAAYYDFMSKCEKDENDFRRLNKLCETPLQMEEDVDLVKQCIEQKFYNAYSNAVTLYTEYIDSVKQAFRNHYTEQCLKANAYLESDAKLFEYHYTLYYYDQSHNLVKTIPPEGVEFLTTAEINQLQLDRSQTIVPGHRLASLFEYNSFNLITKQTTPDGGTTQFWFDALGRLIASQNSEQKAPLNGGVNNRYSYTKYDPILGRVIEVGEKLNSIPADLNTIDTKDNNALLQWQNSGNDVDITETIYDKKNVAVVTNSAITSEQFDYLSRKRAVARIYKKIRYTSVSKYDAATHFKYDVIGNVVSIWQESERLKEADPTTAGLKKIDYIFDVISGKVKEIYYQKNKGDQFIYRYNYDAENRVTEAISSRDGFVWQKDARYNYYLHGSLARVELGNLRVQGIDNAYTLQGWLKKINGPVLSYKSDIGRDGDRTYGLNAFTSRDALSFGISYYYEDYFPIKAFSPLGYTENIPGNMGTGNDIFNGNIKATSVHISQLGEPIMYSYRYDQLNRLVKMRKHSLSYTVSSPNTSASMTISNPVNEYGEEISYDGNGNIRTYLRNGLQNNLGMDNLTYQYERNNGKLVTNKLRYVHDQVSDGAYPTEDINSQTSLNYSQVLADTLSLTLVSDNYQYDAIGNLISDKKELITKIEWTPYGKIKRITKSDPAQTTIDYEYDAGGNRIFKKVSTQMPSPTEKKTYYIKDVEGNVIAVYEKTNNSSVIWTEQHLYGSSRVGISLLNTEVPLNPLSPPTGGSMADGFTYGKVAYELTNHLGNVLATISDKKLAQPCNDPTICPSIPNGVLLVDYYLPDIISVQDYYPGGMMMPGRNVTNAPLYRYGYQSSERDDETVTNDYTTYFREIDTRISRWWSVDPKISHGVSPYVSMGNNPVWYNDIKGDVIKGATKDDASKAQSDIKAMLKDEKFSKVRDLIKIGKDKKTLDKIDLKQAMDALKGQKLTPDEMSLLFGIIQTMNSDKVHEVAYVKNSDVMSEEQEKLLMKGFPEEALKSIREKNNGIPFWLISQGFTGEGVTTPTDNGTYTFLISDVPDKGKTDYFNSKTKQYEKNPAGRPATFGHEVFGHGRSLVLGRTTSQHEDAVQTENLIIRVMGYPDIQRDGTNHGNFSQIGKPSATPAYMDIQKIVETLIRWFF